MVWIAFFSFVVRFPSCGGADAFFYKLMLWRLSTYLLCFHFLVIFFGVICFLFIGILRGLFSGDCFVTVGFTFFFFPFFRCLLWSETVFCSRRLLELNALMHIVCRV